MQFKVTDRMPSSIGSSVSSHSSINNVTSISFSSSGKSSELWFVDIVDIVISIVFTQWPS